MSKYLISVTETYRVDEEFEAEALINEAKRDGSYELAKYTTTKKERKQKGEVIDSWFNVVLTKKFDDEKEPCNSVKISYEVD